MSKGTTILAVILGAAVLLSFIIPAHVRPDNYPADDSYFYLQVAHNIYAGYGSTFNRIVPTNGYHPLWMVFCVAAFFLAHGDKLLALHIVIAFQQVLALGIIYFIYRISRLLRLKYWFMALPILFVYYATRLYACEGYLNGFLVIGAVYAALVALFGRGREPLRFAVVGVIAGLAALARLDNIFVIGSLFLFTTLECADWRVANLLSRKVIKTALFLFLPFLLVVSPYLALNYFTFGHLVPISGSIKSAQSGLFFNLGGVSSLGKVCMLFAAVNLILCATAFCDRARRATFLILSVGVLLHAMQIIFLTNHHTKWPWYYFSGAMNMSLSFAILTEIVAGNLLFLKRLLAPKVMLACALILSLLINAYALFRYRYSAPTITLRSYVDYARQPARGRWQEELGNWLGAHFPEGTNIIIYDWPGIIAYHSGCNILSTDGLINDFQYNDDILRLGISGYLKEKGIQYWLGPVDPASARQQTWYNVAVTPGGYEVEVLSPLYRKSAGSFEVSDSRRVATFREVLTHTDTPDLGLWRID